MRAMAICALLALGGCQRTDIPAAPYKAVPTSGFLKLATTPEGCVLYGAYGGRQVPYAYAVVCPAGFTGGVS